MRMCEKMSLSMREALTSPEYVFLRENPHLKDNIILLMLGGSHAYGTNVEGSDIDVRGVALNSRSDLIGLSSFENVVDKATDTTVYSFNHFINLILNCNPNTIELLSGREEDYFIITKIGQELISNSDLFLSQKAVYSFGGYANQQLRRLQNALARDFYPTEKKEEHILETIFHAMDSFNERYASFDGSQMILSIGKCPSSDLDSELCISVNLNAYPARDYKNIISEINSIIKSYDKLNKRNTKKDDLSLNKHAMHLVRLYLMCIDILEKGEIITYRENDRELLLDIRGGCYQKNDETYDESFFELINELEGKVKYAKLHTNLPKLPNYRKVEDFVMSVNERVVKND